MKIPRLPTGFLHLLLLGCLLPVPVFAQTNYYWAGSGNGNLASSWGINSDGSGQHPPGFTAADQIFTVQGGQDLNVFSAPWKVTGPNSSVLVETSGTIEAAGYNHTITLGMESGAAYVVTSAYTNLTFGAIDAGSTFVIGGNLASIQNLAYGGLRYQSSSNSNVEALTTTGNFEVATGAVRATSASANSLHTIGGNVVVDAGADYLFFDTNAGVGLNATINIAGGLVNDGTFGRSATGGNTATLNFNGNGSSTVKWGAFSTAGGAVSVNIDAGKTIESTDSVDLGGGDLTVAGTLILDGGQSINVAGGVASITGTLASEAAASGTVTLAGSPGSEVVFGDNSTISLTLGAAGAHSVLSLEGFDSQTFAASQSFLFNDLGAGIGDYDNIIMGLAVDPGVAGWTIANAGWVGTFSFDGGNVDLSLTAVPEPAVGTLLAASLLFGAFRRRTRRGSVVKFS